MLTLSVSTTGLRCHVYVSRWTTGAATPERVLDIAYELPGAIAGRESLRLALERVLLELAQLP